MRDAGYRRFGRARVVGWLVSTLSLLSLVACQVEADEANVSIMEVAARFVRNAVIVNDRASWVATLNRSDGSNTWETTENCRSGDAAAFLILKVSKPDHAH
jgi:hypothetical protein